MFDPVRNLPDDILIEMVRFPAMIRNALTAGGLKTIGEVRALPDAELRRITRIGKESLTYLRKTLGKIEGRSEMTDPTLRAASSAVRNAEVDKVKTKIMEKARK
jgi:DNA-directed RNA polymerase alpha subunit